MQTQHDKLLDKQALRVATIHRLAGQARGRPVVNRSAAELREETEDLAPHAIQAMSDRGSACLGKYGESGSIALEALMRALVGGLWLHQTGVGEYQ